MISEQAIRTRLRSYLSGDISLEAFEDWLIDATEGADRANQREIIRLRAAINLQIAEYTGGFMNEVQLRERLETLAPNWIATDQQVDEPSLAMPGTTEFVPSRKPSRGSFVLRTQPQAVFG